MKLREGKPLDSSGKSVNNKLGKPFVVKHFVSLGVSGRTAFSILETFESGETLEKKGGRGRKPLKLPQSKQEPTGETGLRPCWCVTALFGQEFQHQQILCAPRAEESWCEAQQMPEGP